MNDTEARHEGYTHKGLFYGFIPVYLDCDEFRFESKNPFYGLIRVACGVLIGLVVAPYKLIRPGFDMGFPCVVKDELIND